MSYLSGLEQAVICTNTWHGGCKEWETLHLNLTHMDKSYPFLECYNFCHDESDCGGFARLNVEFLGAPAGACLFYRDGCTLDENQIFEFCSIQRSMFLLFGMG